MRLGLGFGSALMAALAIGCGGSGSGYPTGGTTSSTGGSTPGGVSIAEFSFTPDTITVKMGTSVVWTNDGTVAHTVTADSTGGFDSGQLSSPTGGGAYGGGSPGGSYAFLFNTAGTFTYHCQNHPMAMKGVVIVTP